MKLLRRILGILVMIAGVLGLALSLAGLVGVWTLKPTIASVASNTIVTLNDSIHTSQNAMKVTGDALAATVDSVDALSTMLGATAASVKDTQPVLDQVNSLLGEELPATMEAATSSLKTAQQAAVVLDAAIKSLETFRTLLSAAPLVGGFVQQPAQAYNPQVPLAESLGDLASNLEDLPEVFTSMSENMDKADDNLATIETSLSTMADSVSLISTSLSEYEMMVAQSQASMDNLEAMLTSVQNNLTDILNYAAIGLTLAFFWLMAAQVVIFSQGWELYQGTAGRIESGETEPAPA